jgi:hypothetical protein
MLKDLGAVAMTVFSKQIAGSITTTINNFEKVKQQTQYVKNAIAEAK